MLGLDLRLELSGRAIEDAQNGDPTQLLDELRTSELEGPFRSLVRSALESSQASLETVEVTLAGVVVRRVLVGSEVAILVGVSDDQDAREPTAIASSGAELLHVLLGAYGLGGHPRREEEPREPIELDEPESILGAVLGERPFPGAMTVVSDTEPRLWSMTDGEGSDPVIVLDTGRLWLVEGHVLVPTDPMTIWAAIGPLLGGLNRIAMASLISADGGETDDA